MIVKTAGEFDVETEAYLSNRMSFSQRTYDFGKISNMWERMQTSLGELEDGLKNLALRDRLKWNKRKATSEFFLPNAKRRKLFH